MDIDDFLDALFLGGSTYMLDDRTGRTNDPSDYTEEERGDGVTLDEYDARLARWRERVAVLDLTEPQAYGLTCIACGCKTRSMVPVGRGPLGQVFGCIVCDAEFSNR